MKKALLFVEALKESQQIPVLVHTYMNISSYLNAQYQK